MTFEITGDDLNTLLCHKHCFPNVDELSIRALG